MTTATRRRRFHPYRYAGRHGRLSVTSLVVDGRDVPVLEDQGRIDLSAVGPRDELRMTVTYAVPGAVWDVLPPDERRPDAVRVVLLAEEPATLLRTAVRLTPGPDGVHRGTLALSPADLREGVELQCVVARATARDDLPAGFARELAAELGGSEVLSIRLAEARESAGSFLSVRWERFSVVEPLRPWSGQAWYFQLTADPPILWLNEELPDLAGALRSGARTGRPAAVRDLLFHTIATAGWTAMFGDAARGLARGEDGEPTYGRDWHAQVLGLVARHTYPDRPVADRLPLLIDRIVDAGPESWALLQEEVALGLARWSDLGEVVRRSIGELTR
ncbi:MAG: hypothetical protein ABMB14_24580 [Myxococcota bacterium]